MTITEITTIVSSGAAMSVAILSIVKFWMSRTSAKLTTLIATTKQDLLRAIMHNIERQFANDDKATYVTLDYRMDGDVSCLRIPLGFNKVTECLLGMRLQLVEHSIKETVYSISTLGHHAPVRLHWHYHEEMEAVQVVRGTVTDVDTARRYGPGEIWIIEPGERHIADFDNAYALCTVRPPLPLASQHPINLTGGECIYDSPEPTR